MPTDVGYTGQRADSSTGLMYYSARYYDSALARFVSADSIVPGAGNPQTLNRYSYVLGNPLKYTDPSGHAAYDDSTGTEICDAECITRRINDCNGSHPCYEQEVDSAITWIYGYLNEGEEIFGNNTRHVLAGFDNELTPISGAKSIHAGRLSNDQWTAFLMDAMEGAPALAAGVRNIVSGAAEDAGAALAGIANLANPNRPGKLGGPLHRATVEQIIQEIEASGGTWDTEYGVLTPNGIKSKRYVDVVELGVDGTPTTFYQVGRQTQAGLPVSRERIAIADIKNALGSAINVIFRPYR
ncbi:MAG: hypothetical protein HZB53_00530 [Chloroflexi bacterium]|nr:hypothetical protein [Chloroflexota bacterium]